MNKLLICAVISLISTSVSAKDYIVKEVTDSKNGSVYFEPNKLTIQPGDTVIFENAQDDMHEVMFVNVPKAVNEMIMSPMHEKKGDKFSYTFTVPGTYKFHCHPHEELNMEGTLIVGQPSKPGETKDVDHHALSTKLDKGETSGGVNTPASKHDSHSGHGK